jgi:hypothetical protein
LVRDWVYIKNIANKTSFSSNEFIKGCTATIKTGTKNYDCRINLPMADPDQIIGFFAIAYDNNLNQRFVGGTYREDGQAQLVNMEYWGNPVLWGGATGFVLGVGAVAAGFTTGTVTVLSSINGVFTAAGAFSCSQIVFNNVSQDNVIDCGLTVLPIGKIIKIGSDTFKVEQIVQKGAKNYAKIVKSVRIAIPVFDNLVDYGNWVAKNLNSEKARVILKDLSRDSTGKVNEAGVLREIDLYGKSHNFVPTPHVKVSTFVKNTNTSTGEVFYNGISETVPAVKTDLDLAVTILNN